MAAGKRASPTGGARSCNGVTDEGEPRAPIRPPGPERRRAPHGPRPPRRRLLRHHLRAQPHDERGRRLLDVEREPALPVHDRAAARPRRPARRTPRGVPQPAGPPGALAALVDDRLRTLLRAADLGRRARRRLAGGRHLAAGDRHRHRPRRAGRRPGPAAHPRRLGADRGGRGPHPARAGRRHRGRGRAAGGAAGTARRDRLPPRQPPPARPGRSGRGAAHPRDDARLATAVAGARRHRRGHPTPALRRAVGAVVDRRAALRRGGHHALLPGHRPGAAPPRRPRRRRGHPGSRGAVHPARRGAADRTRGARASRLDRTGADRRRAVRARAGPRTPPRRPPAAGRRCPG
ncbi:hypothetical protein DC74_7220 [Streptomyces noursei]|nr:hypothetical protein DC74_7220 [Streptomyces noursei]